ncbi:MAG TPA: type II CAAX endopeptidase family protein [Paenibacillus cookii]|nr:type II CAAX endopeptidase family protein [Paenibacillus cookii]
MKTTNQQAWPKDPWSVKELAAIVFLAFVLVPWLVEVKLYAFLEQWFDNTLYAGTLMGFVLSVVYMASLYLIALYPHQAGWSEVGLRSFPRKYWSAIVLWSAAVLALGAVMLLVMTLLGGGYENSKTDSLQSHANVLGILIAITVGGVISPIYEEILYRGFLYRWFRTRFGAGWALFISSSLFTIAHIPTYNTLPLNFASGLIFAWTYEKTRSVVPGMIVHGLTNTVAVLLTVFA